MFKKDQKEEVIEEYTTDEEIDEKDLHDTVIAQGVKVEGDFKSKGNVIIEGMLAGSVKTNNDLTVGEKAKITASVGAQNATISGEVQGNVKIQEKLELTPTAKIYGDIEAKTLIITAGATFNGKCIMPNGNLPARKSTKAKKQESIKNA